MTDPALPRDERADPLDSLLLAQAPSAIADDGFVERTMRAVARADPAPARVARPAPLAIARALAREQHRHAAQARLRRWALAGVGVGLVLWMLALVAAPSGVVVDVGAASTAASAPSWLPLWLVMMGGAIWYAWSELRRN